MYGNDCRFTYVHGGNNCTIIIISVEKKKVSDIWSKGLKDEKKNQVGSFNVALTICYQKFLENN